MNTKNEKAPSFPHSVENVSFKNGVDDETHRFIEEMLRTDAPDCFGSFAQAKFNREKLFNPCLTCAYVKGCNSCFENKERILEHWPCFGDGKTNSGRLAVGDCKNCGFFNDCGKLNSLKEKAHLARKIDIVLAPESISSTVIATIKPAIEVENATTSAGLESVADTSSTSAAEYSFTTTCPDFTSHYLQYKEKNSAELCNIAQKLCSQLSDGIGYLDLRNELCAAHMALNFIGEVSPGFRAWNVPRVKGSSSFSAANKMYNRDRQIIDLDWIYRYESRDPSRVASSIFSGESFGYSAAEKFACLSHKTADKLSDVGLAYTTQWKLTYFCDPKQRADRTELKKKSGEVAAKIREAKGLSTSRRTESDRELLATHTALSMCSGSLPRAAELIRAMGYCPPPPATLRRMNDWFRRLGIPTK